MSLSLLSPLLLLGLLGLALPVLAHLLGRERPQRVRFAALRFVVPREPVITQRRAIRDWPLLLVRLLLLALLVLVLARPVVGSEAEVRVLAEPHDAIVLLDASASMELREPETGKTQRDLARERLETLLDAMPPGSRIGLVIADPRAPELELREVVEGVPAIRARVDEWASDAEAGPRPGAWTLGEALPRALGLLGEQVDERPRVVYAIGDPTSGGLGSLPALAGEAVTVVPVPTRGRPGELAPPAPEHVGLREPSVEPAPELDPRALRISAIAHRHGGGDALLEVGVALVVGDEEVARTRVSLAAEGDAAIEFVHTPAVADDAAPTRARIELLDRPDDALPIDDRRHLWLSAAESIDMLIVNGDPSDTRTNDEIFFLSTALTSSEAPIELRGLSPDQLEDLAREGRPLAEVELLVLANVRAPSKELAAMIAQRVEQGMGLWISVGDRVAAGEYNERFGELLPLLLREAVFTGTAPGRTEARSEGLAPIVLAHPIFAGMPAEEAGALDLATTETKRVFLLDPDPRRASDIALAFTSGAPALITRARGEGRVALLTTSIDRDWGDLPLRPGFVPLVVRTALWLARSAGTGRRDRLEVGEVETLDQGVPYIVHTPSGEALPVAAEQQGEPTRFTHTDQPGHYRAVPQADDETRASPLRPELFVVEVDARESDTTPVTIAAAELGGEAGSVTIYAPRWRELAMLALLLLGLESALRWWLGRSRA